MCVLTAEHKRFVQLIDMRFKDINGYMTQMSSSIEKYLQVHTHRQTDRQTDAQFLPVLSRRLGHLLIHMCIHAEACGN